MSLIIEKGINPPVPKEYTNLANVAEQIYTDFDVEDSCFLPLEQNEINNIKNRLNILAKQNERPDIKFKSVRAMKDKIWGYRIWRIS